MSVTDEQVIEALLNTPTKKRAAGVLGVSRQAIYDRLKKPGFTDKLDKAAEVRRKALEVQATSVCEAATEVLAEIMGDTFYNPGERLRAAQIALSTFKPK